VVTRNGDVDVTGGSAAFGISGRGGADRLLWSSVFLIGATAITAGLGFAFWLVVARIYSPGEVGTASSLISAAMLVAYLAQLGLNGAVVRFMASSRHRNAQITISSYVVLGAACVFAAIYVFVAPMYTPRLEFVRAHVLFAAGFVLFAGLSAVNILTDSVFVAARRPEYNLFIDGFLQGLTKLALPISLVSIGAYGIFLSTGVGFAVAVVASYFFMRRALGFRFRFTRDSGLTRGHGAYSMSAYTGNLLHLIPVMLLPIIALQALGDANAGYFYLAYQVANLIYAISFAVGQAVFAEGSYDESRLRHLMRRSATIIAMLQVPAVALLALLSAWVLSVIGPQYSEAGTTVLVVLALASIGVAINNWAGFVLNLTGLMRHFIVANLILCVLTIGIAESLAPKGLVWIGVAWFVGNAAAGVYGCAALWYAMTRRPAMLCMPSRVAENRPVSFRAADCSALSCGNDTGRNSPNHAAGQRQSGGASWPR
jgi:O-antigen/teichoic acid export membrane protein